MDEQRDVEEGLDTPCLASMPVGDSFPACWRYDLHVLRSPTTCVSSDRCELLWSLYRPRTLCNILSVTVFVWVLLSMFSEVWSEIVDHSQWRIFSWLLVYALKYYCYFSCSNQTSSNTYRAARKSDIISYNAITLDYITLQQKHNKFVSSWRQQNHKLSWNGQVFDNNI